MGATANTAASLFRTSTDPVITPDGRFVAFYSSANTMVAGANTMYGNIFLRDLLGGTIVLCSTNISYPAPQISSAAYATHPVIQRRRPAMFFTVSGASGGTPQYVYLYDSVAVTNSILFLSHTFPPPAIALSPQPAIDDVFGPEITPDGRFVAYLSESLVNNTNYSSVHVWDAQSTKPIHLSARTSSAVSQTPLSLTPR